MTVQIDFVSEGAQMSGQGWKTFGPRFFDGITPDLAEI